MEQEKPNEQENLRQTGRAAADALRGYGYDEVAQQYEQVLHRFAPDSKEVLAHSRIASTTLKELNQLSEQRLGKNPALERTVEVQQRLEQALQPEHKPKALEELSFPARQYLESRSKPLEQASEEVSRYLEEKSRSGVQREDDTKLRTNLNQQLDSYRALPTAYNLERLEKYTRQGIEVMRTDYEQAKAIQQKENEEYVVNAKSLSSHGRAEIMVEANQGDFRMPNQQKGQHVALRTDRAEQQLEQYTQVRAKITGIDQDYQEITQHSLRSPRLEMLGQEEVHKKTASSYSHLSTEKQERYAELMAQPSVSALSRQAEVEL